MHGLPAIKPLKNSLKPYIPPRLREPRDIYTLMCVVQLKVLLLKVITISLVSLMITIENCEYA